MLAGVALLLVAAVVLVVGTETFVENAAAAARRLGTTVLAVGVLLAGAEPEELVTAVLASARDRPDLAAGDAVGANVTMLTAALGLAALARPLPAGRRVREYAVLSAVAGLLALLALADETVGRVEGALLVLAYVALVAAVWRRERRPPVLGELAEAEDEGDRDAGRRSPTAGLLLGLAGIGLMVLGGHLAVTGAARVAEALGAGDTPVGLTLLALATTAELFALAWSAARRGVTEIAVAGVVGSAAYNATMTLGAAAVVAPLATTAMRPAAVLAALLPLALVVLARRGHLGRAAGAVLVTAYAVYVVLVLVR
ncbi:MAG: sodium:calcium antiporter [Actinomycetes bacterium]